jgi:DNA-binding transcriptional LysR family regulator
MTETSRNRPPRVGWFVHEVAAHGGGIGGIPSLLAARSVEAGRLVRVLSEHRLDGTR